MHKPTSHDVIHVPTFPVDEALVDLAHRDHVAQAAVAKQILHSPTLKKMVDAVASGEVDGIRIEIVIHG